MANQVICQQWEERERGWGVRPDGYSLHATLLDRSRYIRDYWAEQPDEAPDEYSRPLGQWYYVEVDDETLAQVQASPERYGLRRYEGAPEPPPGMTGVYRRMK